MLHTFCVLKLYRPWLTAVFRQAILTSNWFSLKAKLIAQLFQQENDQWINNITELKNIEMLLHNHMQKSLIAAGTTSVTTLFAFDH